MGDFKINLLGGMQVRGVAATAFLHYFSVILLLQVKQHLPKGKVRDVKIWVATRGGKKGGPEKKRPASVSAGDWQNNWWYLHVGSEARNSCW
jgi:hypothetical protein